MRMETKMIIKPIDLHIPCEIGSVHLRMETTDELIVVGEDSHRAILSKHQVIMLIEHLKSMSRIMDEDA